MYYESKSNVVKVGDTVTYELNGKNRTHTILPFSEIWKPISMSGAYDSPYTRSEETTGADPNKGTISEKTPVAQALLGKHVDEAFSYVVNGRNFAGKIIKIENTPKPTTEDKPNVDSAEAVCECPTNVETSNVASGVMLIKQGGFYYNVSGNDALLLHKYLGYKVFGVNVIRTGFPVARRDTVLKKIDALQIDYDVYDINDKLIISQRFSPNNYEELDENEFVPTQPTATSNQTSDSTPKTTQSKIELFVPVLQALSEGINLYTGEVINGIDERLQNDLSELLLYFEDKQRKRVRAKEDNPNMGQSWTQDEDEQLAQEYNAKMDLKEIAKLHGRTAGAIQSRLLKLHLI